MSLDTHEQNVLVETSNINILANRASTPLIVDLIENNDDSNDRLTDIQTEPSDTNDNTNDAIVDNDLVSKVYQSMSKVIETLTNDSHVLNVQLQQIKAEISTSCCTYDQKLTDHLLLLTNIQHDIDNIKLKKDSLVDIQKQLLDTRTTMLQMFGNNIHDLKREINDVKKIKEELRQQARTVIVEEMKEYMNKMPTLEAKFDELAKDLRANLAQHIRKSTIQRVGAISADTSTLMDLIRQQIKETGATSDVDLLRKQQLEFMNKIEQAMVEMKAKLEALKPSD